MGPIEPTVIEVAPRAVEAIVDFVSILFTKHAIILVVSALAIGGLTFTTLDLFLRPGLEFQYGKTKIDPKKHDVFVAALFLVGLVAVPLIIAIAQATHIVSGTGNIVRSFSDSMEIVIISMLVCGVLGWLLSLNLKRHIQVDPNDSLETATAKRDAKKRQFLIGYAMRVILETTGENISDWLARIVMGIINIGIKIIHKPFIMEYAIVAIILNLVFSFVILQLMGESNAAGSANIIGSLLGGIAHWWARGSQIKEVRATYMDMFDKPGNANGNE